MIPCNTYYDSFRTRKFTDIFPDFKTFAQDYASSALKIDFALDGQAGLTIEQFYYMMYARYGNSHLAYTDENQFKFAMWTIVFQYGPSVSKRLEIQSKLRNLSEDDMIRGGKAIYNTALNPGTPPSTNTLEELTTINSQNTTNYKKSKLEGYATLMSLIETDVLEEFLSKFRKLFLTVVSSGEPLLYETIITQEEE